MRDPQHASWWTRQRRTEWALRYTRLETGGLSLPVLLAALDGPGIIWYSRVTSTYYDVVEVFATPDPPPDPALGQLHPAAGPVTAWLGTIGPVTEYVLTDAVAEAYDLNMTGAAPWEDPRPSAGYIRAAQEDAGWIYPADDAILRRVVMRTLEVHSFYLGQAIGWGSVAEALFTLLRERNAVQLETDPGPPAVVGVRLPLRRWSYGSRYRLRYAPRGQITFENGRPALALAR